MKQREKKPSAPKGDFVRATITLPGELDGFMKSRAAEPQHAGNFSSYVRNLILKDREVIEKEQKAQAA
jgi:hypothetical protein